jgi:hypothetical protein
MNKLTKFLPIVVALTAIADTNFQMLVSIGINEILVNWIKLIGLLLAIFTPSIQELWKEDIVRLKSDNTDPVPTTHPSQKPPKRP